MCCIGVCAPVSPSLPVTAIFVEEDDDETKLGRASKRLVMKRLEGMVEVGRKSGLCCGGGEGSLSGRGTSGVGLGRQGGSWGFGCLCGVGKRVERA